MTKRILIDAVYPDETRVVIHENNVVQEFDYETAAKKQIKGNIYLAKITRIEPSLQAAFIEYGADKHGFLPFSEIHPDYYQLPVSDRSSPEVHNDVVAQASEELLEISDEELIAIDFDEAEIETLSSSTTEIGGEDEIVPPRRTSNRRYKIQEVLKRNQVILVQAIKEERGTKGASFTSYISLAGRYCVLMPNSERQSGISKRINDGEDRKRLREIIEGLELADSISIIIRTAGSSKNKADIKRDYDYLIKLWNSIREHTLNSKAPTFIHAEGDLIKRTIRDLYDQSINEIVIQGDEALNKAKAFMKIIMPSHVTRIKPYKNKTPVFCFYQVEEQISSLYSQIVQLSSGGYLVINPTEALISIDVNSGRSTSERNVEETATKTNLEAATEIARQMRLRDLSGLVVIDFIDMSDSRNRINVEKTLKDSLRIDRAKIQVGIISSFGLLEMSRQRLRSSFIEANTVTCKHCNGKGLSRAPDSNAVMILRTIESEIYKGEYEVVNIYASTEAVIYVLNNKRADIADIEQRYHTKIIFHADEAVNGDGFAIEKVKKSAQSSKAETGSLTKDEVDMFSHPVFEEDVSVVQEEAGPASLSRNKKRNWKKNRNKTLAQTTPLEPTIVPEVIPTIVAEAVSEEGIEKKKPRKRYPRKKSWVKKSGDEAGESSALEGKIVEPVESAVPAKETNGAAPEKKRVYKSKKSAVLEGSGEVKKPEESILRGLWKRITE
jgi:ribonuclease E